MLRKIIIIVLGILTVFAGIYVIANPEIALPLMGGMMAIAMCVFATSSLLNWFERRAEGEADVFSLIMAILGYIFSLLFAGNILAQLLSAEIMLYMELAFVVVEGIILIIDAFRMRGLKNAKRPILQKIGASWGWILAAGILMAVTGIFALCNPLGAVITNGVYMGIGIVAAGIAVIVEEICV